jgi:ABC-type transport system, involved in lipoprotein release, permease component
MAGLSVSFALVLILSAYSYSEFTTDKFHKNHKRVFLIQQDGDFIYTPALLKNIVDNISGVEKSVRVRDMWNPPVLKAKEEDPINSDMIFADKQFFDLFDYQSLEGNLQTALEEPMSVCISTSLATRLFGNTPAVGKTIKLNNSDILTVTAVFKEKKSNTILSFHSICNLETMQRVQPSPDDFTHWDYNNYQTFVLLKPGYQPGDILNSIIKSVPGEAKERFIGGKLLALDKIYFSKLGPMGSSFIKTGNKARVWYLVAVAFLVLTVALVNFINITTTRWNEKIKQTGIMKIIGANLPQLMGNMMLETFFLFWTSLMIAFFLAILVIPFLMQNTMIQFNHELLRNSGFILVTSGCITAFGFLCGAIPSLRIASSNALVNLKKRVSDQGAQTTGKGILVTLQFAVAIILIVFTILVQKQVEFGCNSLGINQENIVGIEITDQLKSKKDILKEMLSRQANVESVTFTQYYPGKTLSSWGHDLYLNGEKKKVQFNTFSADAGFFGIMGLKLLNGRFYNDTIASDSHKVVVNEQFLTKYGITNPLGGIMSRGENIKYEIVGVVKDFHFMPVNEPIMPLMIRNDNNASVALVKLRTATFSELHSTLKKMTAIAAELSPDFPSDVSFFDQAIQNMYLSEIRFRNVFTIFSFCAIAICCLGILAMSLFACQRRIKEIGIRKVNGAKVREVMAMLNRDFVKWVAIAFVIATPIAYYAMNKWLENFAYKTELSWWIFALAGLAALGIALLTVSWQSWKAATRNPVEALRYE